MKTLAVVQQKGGSGKTTLVVNLAVVAAVHGLTVVVIDLDRQGSALAWFGRRPTDDIRLMHVEPVQLRQALDEAEHDHKADLVILDTPGKSDAATATAIKFADLCLLPCQPASVDLDAAAATVRSIRPLKKEALFVITQAPPRKRRPGVDRNAPQEENFRVIEAITDLKEEHGLPVFERSLTRLMEYENAFRDGQGALERPNSVAAADLIPLWQDIAERLDLKPSFSITMKEEPADGQSDAA